MPRPLVVGNGQLLINFDAGLNMRDLYFPHVGMLNHICGHRNALGVWVDGEFEWLDRGRWRRELAYEEDTLITRARAHHGPWQLTLTLSDTVHFRHNLFLKRVQVRSESPAPREVRLIFTHDFSIDETEIGDTALYDPSADALIHYKRDRAFLISGYCEGPAGREGIFQYATGTKRFGGAEGTWRDAEDGHLEGNPIAQGSVDSALSFRLTLASGAEATLWYWIAAGRGFEAVRRLHVLVRQAGPAALLDETRAYWRAWVNRHRWDFSGLPPAAASLYKRSLLLLRTQIDHGGGILAANDSDILQYNRDHYSYVWPRDGALVGWALVRAGYPELARRFFLFCRRILAPGGFLWHKYNPDGSVGSSWHPWVRRGEVQLPIQEDETALVLFALWRYFRQEKDLEFVDELYEPLVKAAADFLAGYRDPRTRLPLDSYDLWEERRGVFTFTAAAVYAGLRAAARFAELFGDRPAAARYGQAATETRQAILTFLYDRDLGRFIRGLVLQADGSLAPDPTLESSLAGLFLFRVLGPQDPRLAATMEAVEEGLAVRTPVGGICRYPRDHYFQKSADLARIPGNPWILCTLWLAQWHITRARTLRDLEPALRIFSWCAGHALPGGALPEQLHPETGEPVSVAPLAWSHGSYVLAVVEYLEKVRRMKEREALAQVWHAAP